MKKEILILFVFLVVLITACDQIDISNFNELKNESKTN